MLGSRFSMTDIDNLLPAIRDKYFYLQDLIERHKAAKRADDEQTLGQVNLLVRRKTPINQWEPEQLNSFLQMGCRLARAEVLALPPIGDDCTAMLEEVCGVADLLCSVVVAGSERVDPRAQQQTCALWAMTHLSNDGTASGLAEFLASAIVALEPLGMPTEELSDQIRAQCVLYVVRTASGNGAVDALPDSELAREWCSALLAKPVGRLLARAAEALGVPQPVQSFHEGDTESDEATAIPRLEPAFFTAPERLAEDQARQEFEDCLFILQGLTYEEICPLSPQTASQVRSLRPVFGTAAFGQPFYYAAQNLWRSYWERGDDDSLSLTARLAQLLFNVEEGPRQTGEAGEVPALEVAGAIVDVSTVASWIVAILQEAGGVSPYTRLGSELRRRYGDAARDWLAKVPLGQTLRRVAETGHIGIGGESPHQYAFLPEAEASPASNGLRLPVVPPTQSERDGRTWRTNALHVWINTQLPQLIQTCPLSVILEDANKLCCTLGCELQGSRIRQGLIQAVAGSARKLELADAHVERAELLSDHESELRSIHQEFIASAVSKQNRDDELAAWDYLFPAPAASEELVESTGPNQFDDSLIGTPPPVTTITADPIYLKVVKAGDEGALNQYISENLDRIHDLLLTRLDARLAPERLLRPDREVRIRNAGKIQPAPLFVEALQALDREDWKGAARKLDRLEPGVRGQNVQICQNFRAYALARDGDLLGARLLLGPLTNAGFQSPAAYWNLACCITNQDSEQERLDVLARGLDAAPHPWLLNGAIALAMLLEDDRLRGWLPFLTLSEALLLSIYYEADTLSREERDQALLRLREYATNGEPRYLDPTSTDRQINYYAMRDHLNALRLQPKAAEFWLRCREPLNHHMFAYWQLRSEFLDDQNRTLEAAQAFEEELRCRLYALDRNWIKGNPVNIIRSRAQNWLRKCLRSHSAELETIGQRIYNRLIDYQGPLRANILPTDKEVNERYRSKEESSEEPSEEPSPESLTILLTRVGVVCLDKLHEPRHLARVHSDLTRLVAELRRHNRPAVADAFDQLMRLWDQHADQQSASTLEERREVLRQARGEYAKLEGAAQRELTPEERGAAANLLAVAHRVNDKLTSALDLLPPIVALAPEGNTITVDDSFVGTAFAVRLTCPSGSVSVQLVQATARLVGEDIDFPLRDRLDEIPVVVGPEQSTLLTFALPNGFRLPDGATVRVEVNYAFAGEQYRAFSDPIPLERRSCPPLPEQSPYIHGRPLVPEEIEGHFFGRHHEQDEILRSVSVGQQRILYVEGIRRTGKSSLLNSIRREIELQALPLIPVSLVVSTVALDRPAGQVLFNLLTRIALTGEVAAAGVVAPPESLCQENPEIAYLQFSQQLAAKLPDRRVLALVDDFQALVEAGHAAAQKNLPLAHGLTAILNLLHNNRGPSARLLWLFAGHRAKSEFRELVPGALLWANLIPLRIDFLNRDAVHDILAAPLTDSHVVVPMETSARVHELTAGHPEVVQELAETMLLSAKAEGRWLLTPADADAAAREVQYNDDKFADTWYPIRELSSDQRKLMAAFINAVRQPGERIEPMRLFSGQQMSEEQRKALNGLVARNILDNDGKTIGIKAYVLDLWLRRAWSRVEVSSDVNGSVAIFVDVPNLTGGSREPVLMNLRTMSSDSGIPGRFKLESVLDCVERFAHRLSPAPVAVRWAANYPPDSPAVAVCYYKDFLLAKVPEDFHRKGNDDEVLKERIREVEQQYPSVNHFVLVTGDKDFRIVLESRLVNGKHVHVIGREASLADVYRSMAQQYPQRFSFHVLEELLEAEVASAAH